MVSVSGGFFVEGKLPTVKDSRKTIKWNVLIGFPQQADKLVFDRGVGRGHDPADQVPIFDQGAFNGIARKSLRFGGVMT